MIHEPTIILKPEVVQIDESARVDSFCKIEGGQGVVIGRGVHIASFSHINVGGGTTIFEDFSGCSSGCRVGSASPDWSYLHISAASPMVGPKRTYVNRFRSHSILFMGCTVVPGVTLGVGAIALPGSVIFEDVPDWAIVKGNPAAIVGRRYVYEPGDGLLFSQLSTLFGEVLPADAELKAVAGAQGLQSFLDFGVRGLH